MCGFILREKIDLFGARGAVSGCGLSSEMLTVFCHGAVQWLVLRANPVIKTVPECMFLLQREQKLGG